MKKKRILLAVIVIAIAALLLKYSDSILLGLQTLKRIASPLILGCIIAYVLNILVSKIEKIPVFMKPDTILYRIRRPVSILCSLGIIILIIVLIILIVIPQLIQAISVLLLEIPTAVTQLTDWISASERDLPALRNFLGSLDVNWPDLLKNIAAHITRTLSDLFSSTIFILSSIGSMVLNFVVALIFSLYILSGKERLMQQIRSVARTYIKEKYYHKIAAVTKTAHETFSRFIIGQCTEAVIIGILCTIGMFILRFPYASMIGTLVGATALLPVVGAYLGAFVGAFMIFTVAPLKAIGFLIFIVILQQVEGNFIYPKVVGSSVGLPGIWVLAAVTIGGGINGITGMLLAVPVTATLYRLLQNDVRKRKALAGAAASFSDSRPDASPRSPSDTDHKI